MKEKIRNLKKMQILKINQIKWHVMLLSHKIIRVMVPKTKSVGIFLELKKYMKIHKYKSLNHKK